MKAEIQNTEFTISKIGSEIPESKEIPVVAQAFSHNRSHPYHYCLQSPSPLNAHIIHP